MKPQDFMEALGGVSQERLDALAKWQEAGTPITGGAPAKADRITQPVSVQRRREIMKQKAKWNGSFLPMKIGAGAALAVCAVIAVSVGGGIIGLNQQKQQMQIGSNAGTSMTEHLSEHEPLPIEVRAADGIDIDMNLPADGKAQVLHSIDDAQPWIDLLKQSGEYGGESGEGFHPCLEILANEKRYLDRDIIICAVPYCFFQGDNGVAQHAFFGGTITESGTLTVDTGMVMVSKEMRPLMLPDTAAYCCCFTVPKNTMPEITGFIFNNQIYDCTAPLPDDIRSEHDMTEYLAEQPEYQAYAQRFTDELYLRWVKDEMQPADTARKPVLLGEPLSEFNAERNEYFPQVSEKGSVQVIRSMEDMQPLIDATTSQLQTENYGEEFYGRCGINEALFENNDLLYFAFYNDIFADNMSTAMFCGGEINEDGSLTLRFSELIIDDPADDIPQSGSQNCYYFYPAPKGALPDISEIKIELEEFHVTLPERVLEHRNEIDEATGQTIETQYLETAQAKLDYMDSIPQKLSITWGKSEPVPPEDCAKEQTRNNF